MSGSKAFYRRMKGKRGCGGDNFFGKLLKYRRMIEKPGSIKLYEKPAKKNGK
jgi:hypothetical protein